MSTVNCCQIRNCNHPLAESFRGEPVYLCKEHQEKYNKKEPMTLTGNWEDCSTNYETERKGLCANRLCDNDRNPKNSRGFCATTNTLSNLYSRYFTGFKSGCTGGTKRYHNDQNTIHSVPSDIELKLRSAEEVELISGATKCASCSASFGLTCWRYSCCYCGCCNCSTCVPETTEYRGKKIRLCPKCAFIVRDIISAALCIGCKKRLKSDLSSERKFCNFCVFQRRKIVFLLQLKSRVRKWHGVPWQVQLLVAQYVFTDAPEEEQMQMMSNSPAASSNSFTSQNNTHTTAPAVSSGVGLHLSSPSQHDGGNALPPFPSQTTWSSSAPQTKSAPLTKVQQTLLVQEKERNEELGKQLRILQDHSCALKDEVDSLQQQVNSANTIINQQAQQIAEQARQLSSKDSELKLEAQQVNLLQRQVSTLEKQNKELQKLALAAEEKEEEKRKKEKRKITQEEDDEGEEDDLENRKEGEVKKK